MTQKYHALWCEKYRPSTIEDYAFHDAKLQSAVTRMINDKSIPNLLLSGVQGTGKTTLALILLKALNVDPSDTLIINASDERGIDTFRDKVKGFATTIPTGDFRVVLLEEADSLTPDAQQAMRRFMEEYSEVTRFILTCNQEHRIIPPIISRCQHFRFRAGDKDHITEYAAVILAKEQVNFSLDVLDKYISIAYPDVRKIVNLLQQNTVNKELELPTTETEAGDYKFKLLDLVEQDAWVECRKLVCSSAVADDWEQIYKFLYENIQKSKKFSDQSKWEEAILIIAEHLYKHSIVADPEINAAAMFIRLGQL